MRYNLFVQSGNEYQADNNGMMPYVYTFGARPIKNRRGLFCIRHNDGHVTGDDWSIDEEYATTFRLELIMEKTFQNADFPF
jgi:hypothetical protein